jgi:threonyl-tRNA synthetase
MASAVSLTFPDGSKREYPAGTTGREVAESISKSLAKKAVAIALDGELTDLSDPVRDGALEIVTRTDPRALELIRHDTAHVMAEAVQELFPGTQVTIGPVIENGFYYDFARNQPFTPEDLPVIEKKMKEIIARNKPFTKEVWSRDEARRVFEDKGEAYKVELIEAIPADQDLKIYKQGDWFDLCRGPHMASTGQIGTAFKLMKVAGAYWRGDSNNTMLTRIYGTAWADQAELDAYLHMLEEAEKRDHRRLGREMDLFHFQEEGPGVVFWHSKGWKMFQNLLAYMRRRLENDYEEVNAPQILDKSLWETSGHWGWYQENMFAVKSAHAFTNPDDEEADNRIFALKPMNCPGHVQIFKHGLKSYRDLPVRLAEFGNVHRYEPSGALHGLMRVRAFTQDDAHVFCTEEQLEAECLKINDLMMSVYRDFGFEEVVVKLATRPEKRVGTDAMWDHAEDILRKVLDKMAAESGGRIKVGINEGEGTFYGPKFEYTLRDAIGRDWQCGTTQVDFNLPERFGAFYIGADSEKKQPVMVHRAICGSLERFLGILIESHAGHMPLWFAPLQVVVATITSEADDYGATVAQKLLMPGFRSRPTSATRRSTTRSASIRWPRFR